MLSDEEMKAIERLNIYKEKIKDELYPTIDFEEEKALGVVLNLIKKQSKEIEELREKYSKKLIEFQKEREWYEKNYISKDKIKAKIEEIKNTGIDVTWEQVNYTIREQDRAKIQVLQSLLEKE